MTRVLHRLSKLEVNHPQRPATSTPNMPFAVRRLLVVLLALVGALVFAAPAVRCPPLSSPTDDDGLLVRGPSQGAGSPPEAGGGDHG